MRESSNSTVTYGTQRNGEARLAGKMAVRRTAGLDESQFQTSEERAGRARPLQRKQSEESEGEGGVKPPLHWRLCRRPI